MSDDTPAPAPEIADAIAVIARGRFDRFTTDENLAQQVADAIRNQGSTAQTPAANTDLPTLIDPPHEPHQPDEQSESWIRPDNHPMKPDENPPPASPAPPPIPVDPSPAAPMDPAPAAATEDKGKPV